MPDDLPSAYAEGHVRELAVAADAVDLEQWRLVGQRGRTPGEHRRHGASGHQRDELGRRRVARGQVRRDGAAVLEHREPVADAADLLEPVRDVDDRRAGRAQVLDDPEQAVDLVGVEHGGRLVHHDDAGIARQRAGHRHDLLAGGREAADLAGRADLGMSEPAEELSCRAVHVAVAGDAAAGLLVPEVDVVGDAQPVDQVELLVDRGDPGRQRGLRVGERDRLAVPQDRPLVDVVRAGQDLDQRGLAGAVLAEQAVHLARAYDEVDTVEGAYARELLDDAAHLEQGLWHGGDASHTFCRSSSKSMTSGDILGSQRS